MTRIKLHAAYAVQKSSEVRVEYTHEIWKTDDWSWMFANGTPFTYGTTTDGTQVVAGAEADRRLARGALHLPLPVVARLTCSSPAPWRAGQFLP